MFNDPQNKFVSITYTTKFGDITWKDSYRIFPVSLDKLCYVFKVNGKLSKYNENYNTLNVFKDGFKNLKIIVYKIV
jgi:hypothetical protein